MSLRAIPPGLKHHFYALPGKWEIIAGHSASDNEYISLKLSRPRDWWFHLKGAPGSHVLLRHPDDLEPTREQLEAAAAVAAWHSKARNAGKVSVHAARAGDVSKPRGAPTGTVVVKKEKAIKVRPGLPKNGD